MKAISGGWVIGDCWCLLYVDFFYILPVVHNEHVWLVKSERKPINVTMKTFLK